MNMVDEFSLAEVAATVRYPDGDPAGVIVGLIVMQGGIPFHIDKTAAIRMAARGLLWSHIPGDGRRVKVIPVDEDGDRVYDYVRTEADGIYRNNLLALPIWSTSRGQYVSASSNSNYAARIFGR